MPVTGILSQEEHSQEGCEVQNPSVDSIHEVGDNLQAHVFENSSEVSVTTMDSNKDFHDTFAAFASAPSGDAEVERNVDVCTSVTEAEHEAAVGLQDSPAHDSTQVATTTPIFEYAAGVESVQTASTETQHMPHPESDVDMHLGLEHGHVNDVAAQGHESHESAASDCVYFIQTTDASGQVVASIIDPNDLSMYADSVIYKQCLNQDGEIETTIVHSGSSATTQHQTQDGVEETDAQQALQQEEQQIIYAHDLSGQLIPLDPVQSAEEVAPPGKQFVYMQDTTGRIIRTVMDASQNMVPGQQVYYTQSDDGQIITSLMDSSTAAAAASEGGEEQQQLLQAGEQVFQQQVSDVDTTGHQHFSNVNITDHQPVNISDHQQHNDGGFSHQQHNNGGFSHQQHNDGGFSHQQQVADQLSDVEIIDHRLQSNNMNIASQQQSTDANMQHQVETKTHVIDRSASFSIDNGMSGLSMLAELSHLTSGQGVLVPGVAAEHQLAPVTDSSNSVDMDEFRPVAKVTEQVPTCDEGLDSMSSDIAELKVSEVDSDGVDHGSMPQGYSIGQDESLLTRIVSQLSQISPSVCRDNLFIQWQNLDAMCWMDVILIMLVHSPSLRPLTNLDPSHELASTLLVTLLKANRQAQILLQNLLKKHNGAVITDPHTAAPVQDPKTSKIVCKETMDEIGKAINVLYAMREKIWLALQPRLRCERGKHNSPVLVLPLLVRENPTIKKMFTMRYRYVFKCEKCSYIQDDGHSKILPSIPTVPEDFNMNTPCFVRNCFECLAPNQRMMMQFEQLQDFVQMHFVKGLPHSRFDELSFDFNDDHYEVTAFVHYKNNPDHFIAWVRNAPGTMWMECDDLKSVITRYSQAPPNIPPSQVHMVMWERRLAPHNTLVMRDTEDTRLLASLVLTVQQPNTHHTADSDTRSSSLSSSTATSAATSHSSTSLLSGLMTQSLATYAQRGRGSARGGRSNGVQAAASTIAAIRQMNPVTSQLSSVGQPPSAAPSRVIRLPLAALTSSGLSLRGGSPGTARYVLVGNNSQGGTLTRTGTNSRVVVVRTPGGATSISAAQLIQLLQQTGAVGQIGTRLTAAVTSSGASTVAPTTTEASYIVQRDGSVSTASSTDVSERTVFTEQGQMDVGEHGVDGSFVMTNTSQSTQNVHEETSVLTPQTISTLPFSTLGHTINPDTTAKWPQPETSNVLPSQGSSGSTISATEPILSGQVKPSESQQQKFFKVTKPGGGTFLCQLAMKDGKIVLLPVQRSIQADSTSTTSLSTKTEVPAGSQHLLQGSHQADYTRTRLISFPGTQGGSKIKVSSGSFTHTGQPGSKTVIFNSAGRQADANSGVRFDGGSMPAVCTSLGTSADSEIGNVSSPATSLLMDVSARLTPYSSYQQQQQVQESFRYVPPGSNTTHILHTGTSETQGSPGQSGNTSAALSSSDGQSMPSAGVCSVAEEMILNSSDNNQAAAVLTPKQSLSEEFNTAEYIPLGHGRIRGARRGGRGRGGRGRGGRGRGGRGRGRPAIRVSEAELVAPSAVSSQTSTLSDLQQIGAHIIRADCEAVDGVPVVSIPDFSSEIDAQTIMPEISHPASYETHAGGASQQAQEGVKDFTATSSGLESPLASGQISTASYSFNVSTQGTQGSPDRARQPSSTLKHARSLLTGRTTTLQSPSSLLAALSDTTDASVSSQASVHTEVDEVQQAVAQTGSQASAMDVGTDFHFGDSGFSLDDTVANTDTATEDSAVSVDNVHEAVFTQPEAGESDTVMSVEENHESTAERYRMPTELFQPEEESPEKCVKLDEATSRVSVSLSPGMFQESERGSSGETQTLSHSPNRNSAFCSPLREAEMEEAGVQPESSEHTDRITGEVEITAPSVDVVQNAVATFSPSSKVRKGRHRAGTSRQETHKSDIKTKLQGSASDSSDSSAGNERLAGSLPQEEALLHISSTDSVEQSVLSGVGRCATEAEDRLEDGLQDDVDVTGYHSTEGSPKADISMGRSKTCKRGGKKNSGRTRSGHSEDVSVADLGTTSSCDTVDTVPLPELAETSTHVPESDSVRHSEPETVEVDGYTAEPVGVDSYIAEPVGVDGSTAEPFGVDSYTEEPVEMDSYTAEPTGVDGCTTETLGVDRYTAEPVGVDGCTTETVGVDSYTAEPAGVDSYTEEPVGVDGCTTETVGISYTAEPVGVDRYTEEPAGVDSYTAKPADSYTEKPAEVDSYTAEPVGVDGYIEEPVEVDSFTTETVGVDSYTAEPAGVDSYTEEPVGVDGCTTETVGISYTAEPVGIDSYTEEPAGVFSYTAETVGVDSFTAETVGVDSFTAETVGVDGCTAEPAGVDGYIEEPVGVDGCTAEPVGVDGYIEEPVEVDSYTAEPAGVDSYTEEPVGVDGCTTETVGVDGYTAEPAGVDSYTEEPAGVDSYTAETVGVDGYTAEPAGVDSYTAETVGVDGCTAETVGVDGCTTETVGVDSCIAEPAGIDGYTTEPVGVDGYIEEPVGVDGYTTEPVRVDSYIEEPVGVDDYTAEPVGVDGYIEEPVGVDDYIEEPTRVDGYTAEPVGVDGCTAEPVGVDSCTTEPIGVDCYTTEPVGVDSYTTETVGVYSCTTEPVGVDSYTTEPVGVDSYTTEIVGVYSCTAEPVGIDSCTTEPVGVDSYTTEPAGFDDSTAEPSGVDDCTAEPVGVDSCTTEPAGVDSYTAEPAGVDSYTAEPAGVDSYTAEPAGVDGCTAEPAGVDGCTAEPAGVDGCTAEPAGVDGCTAEPAMDSAYVAVEVELKSQDVIEDHQHDATVALFEDSHPDRPLLHDRDSQLDGPMPLVEDNHYDGPTPFVADSHPDRTIPFVEDSHPAETIPIVAESHPDRNILFVEDSQPDRPIVLAEGSRGDVVPVAHVECSQYDETIPEVADSQCDETIPEVADSQCDETIPEVADSQCDETIPEVADSQYDETIPEVADSQCDETIHEVADSQYDETIPQVAESLCDEIIPQVADSQCDETIPQVADSQYDETIPQVAGNQCDETIPEVADSQCDETIPEVADSLCDETIPEVADSQCDETIPQVAGNQCDETIPEVADSQCDETIPEVADSQCDEPIPEVADSQCDETIPEVADSQCDETIPEVADSQCDETIPEVADSRCDETIHSSVLPRKMTRSRGRERSGRSRQGKRGKSSQPLLAESMDTSNAGSGSSPPLAEHAVSSPACNVSGTSTHLSSPENTSIQCSEVFHDGSLVPDSLIQGDNAVEEQLHEDVDHVTPEVFCQVEAECDGSLKVDNSKCVLEMIQEQGSRQRPDDSAVVKESVSQIPLETFSESVGVTSEWPSEGCAHITGLDKEPLHNAGSDDPGEWRPLVASGLGSATDVLLEDEIHTAEHSAQLNNEGIETVTEVEGNVSTKTVRKTRSRAKSRTRKSGKNKRSHDNVAVEAVELCASATESVKETTVVDTPEFSPQKSPRPDPSSRPHPSQQHETHSTSSVGPVSGSLSGGGLMCKSKEESRKDCLEVQESEDVIATVASSASEKTGRPSRPSRPRERTSKHRGKRKSDNSASEHPEPSSTFPAVSSDIKTDCTVNSESKLHSNHLPQMPARQGVILEHRKRVLSPAVRKDVKKKARIEQEVKEVIASSPTAVYYKRKKADWGIVSDVGKGTDQRASFSYKGLTGRCVMSSARHSLLEQERQASVPPRYSRLVHHPPEKSHAPEASSAVVIRRRQKPQQRPELNSSYEIIPLSLNRQLYPGCTGGSAVKDFEGREAFTGVVMRRRQGRADWSCSADPDKALGNLTKERLQSVPVTYCKRLISSLCISRGDLSAAVRVSGKHLEKSVASEEAKADSLNKDVVELEKTGNSGMLDSVKVCHDALVGSEKSSDNNVVDSERTCEDNVGDSEENCDGYVVDSGKTYDHVVDSGTTYRHVADSEKTCDVSEKGFDNVADSEKSSKNVIESETACVSDVVPSDDTGDGCGEMSDQAVCASQDSVNYTPQKKSTKLKNKHKKRKNLSTESTPSAKKAKPSLEDGSPSFLRQSCLKELDDSSIHTDDADTALTQVEAVRDMSPTATSSACLSPTRRSGRTPIPSKKILDAIEYLKMPSPLKLRRVSSVSSDDRQAEFSSDVNLESAPLS